MEKEVKQFRSQHGQNRILYCVDASIQGLEEYTRTNKERLIKAANAFNIPRINLRRNRKITIRKSRKQKWKEKQLYRSFKQQSTYKMTKTWPRKKNLKSETESLLIVAQNNAIRTNYVKAKNDDTQENG